MHGWALLTVIALVAVPFAAVGYRYSLQRNKTRNCHKCGGGGKHRGWLWRYARGPCGASTLLPPRGRCEGGQVPRYGRRLLSLDEKK